MRTIKTRRQTSFRLPTYLLNDLKNEAAKQNRSVNNLVELFLSDSMYRKPNECTLAAMQECESDAELAKVDTSNLQAFIESIEK